MKLLCNVWLFIHCNLICYKWFQCHELVCKNVNKEPNQHTWKESDNVLACPGPLPILNLEIKEKQVMRQEVKYQWEVECELYHFHLPFTSSLNVLWFPFPVFCVSIWREFQDRLKHCHVFYFMCRMEYLFSAMLLRYSARLYSI